MSEGGKAILSIDGGGIRGVIPAMVLHAIEERCERPIGDLFEVIAGTSTGGIIALGLSCPDADGGYEYSAEDLVGLYVENGERIFPPELALLRKGRQLVEEKFAAAGLEAVLADKFGDARLSEAKTGVLVTSYDIERRQPIFFRCAKAVDDPEHDYAMRDVARATSAAPTYFEPKRLDAASPAPDYALVDGGVFANNPGMCAFVDAHAGQARAEDTLMVSIGTGEPRRKLRYEDAKDWGVIGWAPHLLDVVFDGVSDTVDYQLGQILGDGYHRFQTPLDRASDDLDDARRENVEDLLLEGEELIQAAGEELDAVCAKLRARADT
jgi:patatin-like phospholipase/acyl hydrolase